MDRNTRRLVVRCDDGWCGGVQGQAWMGSGRREGGGREARRGAQCPPVHTTSGWLMRCVGQRAWPGAYVRGAPGARTTSTRGGAPTHPLTRQLSVWEGAWVPCVVGKEHRPHPAPRVAHTYPGTQCRLRRWRAWTRTRTRTCSQRSTAGPPWRGSGRRTAHPPRQCTPGWTLVDGWVGVEGRGRRGTHIDMGDGRKGGYV